MTFTKDEIQVFKDLRDNKKVTTNINLKDFYLKLLRFSGFVIPDYSLHMDNMSDEAVKDIILGGYFSHEYMGELDEIYVDVEMVI